MDCCVGPKVLCSRKRTAALYVTFGAEFKTVTTQFVEETVPGSGLTTATLMLPTWLAVAVPDAVSCDDDTHVVGKIWPANITWAPCTKRVPFTVMVKAPVWMSAGLTELTVGIGF